MGGDNSFMILRITKSITLNMEPNPKFDVDNLLRLRTINIFSYFIIELADLS